MSLLDEMIGYEGHEPPHKPKNCQRWISVGEQMPEDYEVVMVGWAGRRDIGKGYLLNGKWHDPLVGKPDVNQPTHWMPLPEPPAS